MPRLTLISHEICPYVQRAAIVLAEKDVPFERVDIDLANKPEWFLALSPLGKVPLLKVADEGEAEAVLFESLPICEYLDETQGGRRLHPEDPLERARHRAWFEVAGGLFAAIWRLQIAPDQAAFAAARDEVEKQLLLLEGALSPGPYFRGGEFSLLDAVFAPGLRVFEVLGESTAAQVFARAPKVAAWREQLAARPSVRGAVRPDFGEKLRRFLAARGSYALRAGA